MIERRFFDSTVDPADKLRFRKWLMDLNMMLDDMVSESNNQFLRLPICANNTAAIAGGLKVGRLYRTGGDPDHICVVH